MRAGSSHQRTHSPGLIPARAAGDRAARSAALSASARFAHRAAHAHSAPDRLPPKVQRRRRVRLELRTLRRSARPRERPSAQTHVLDDQGSGVGNASDIRRRQRGRMGLGDAAGDGILHPLGEEHDRIIRRRPDIERRRLSGKGRQIPQPRGERRGRRHASILTAPTPCAHRTRARETQVSRGCSLRSVQSPRRRRPASPQSPRPR